MTEAKPIVTVTPTIMSGTVVRWYRSLASAENGMPVLSASRNGVMIHGEQWLRDFEPWLEAAKQAHAALAVDPRADLRHLATHRLSPILNG